MFVLLAALLELVLLSANATYAQTQDDYGFAESFQSFLGERGEEMAQTVDEGDAPIVFGEAPAGQSGFAVIGAPDSVDPSNVLRAVGADAYGNTFTNVTGLGTEMLFAEPGSILYGPDAPAEVVNANEHGAYISPITQSLLEGEDAHLNIAEGAFILCSGREMTVSFGDNYGIRLDGRDGHNWILAIRGLFSDGKQDTDRNTTLHFQDFVPGHTMCMMYPEGAYISEGQRNKIVELSHTGGTNCGANGCSGYSEMTFDANNGAWNAVHQPQLNAPWQWIGGNWLNGEATGMSAETSATAQPTATAPAPEATATVPAPEATATAQPTATVPAGVTPTDQGGTPPPAGDGTDWLPTLGWIIAAGGLLAYGLMLFGPRDNELIAFLILAAVVATEMIWGILPGDRPLWLVIGAVGTGLVVVDWLWDLTKIPGRIRARRAAPPATPATPAPPATPATPAP